MSIIEFPSRWNAPYNIHALEGNCGVLAAWGVLRYFHKRTSSRQLIQACRYTKKHGVFGIALAVALKEYGLTVTYYADPDPDPHAIERQSRRKAEQMGLPLKGAIELEQVLGLLTPQTIPVVLYETEEGNGHISPLTGCTDGYVYLPYAEMDERQKMSKEEFVRRWAAPEILGTCVMVSRPRAIRK